MSDRPRKELGALRHEVAEPREHDAHLRRRLDRESLETLERVDGDLESLTIMLESFFNHARELLTIIETAKEKNDLKPIIDSAHRLKGSLATLGAPHGAEAAKKLET